MIAAESAPTEALDLAGDSLRAARLKLIELLKDLYYLDQLSKTSERFGYALPFETCDLTPAIVTLRELATKVVHEEDTRKPPFS